MLKYISELKSLTSCQISNEVRTVVFAAIFSNENPLTVFWGKYDPQQTNSLLIQNNSSSLIGLDISLVPCLVLKPPTDE